MDTKTLYTKIAAVPAPITAHLGSEATIDAIDGLENQFHLPAGSSTVIAKLIQRLQIKDIDATYFAGELAAELKLEKNNALLISEEIERLIFMPIKNDLAQYGIDISLLSKFQMPLIKTPQPLQAVSTAKTATSNLVAGAAAAGGIVVGAAVGAAAVAGPKILSQNFEAQPNATPAVKVTGTPPKPPAPPVPTAPKPPVAPAPNKIASPSITLPQQTNSLSDKGWSRQASQNPVVKLGVITPSVPTPSGTAASAPTTTPATSAPMPAMSAPTKPAAPATKTMSEFDRLDSMKRGSAPQPQVQAPPPTSQSRPQPSSPAPAVPLPPKPPQPGPVMLHQVGTPTQGTPDFKVNTGMQNQMSGAPAPRNTPPKPAVLEFGGSSQAAGSSQPSQTPSTTPPGPAKPPVVVKDYR